MMSWWTLGGFVVGVLFTLAGCMARFWWVHHRRGESTHALTAQQTRDHLALLGMELGVWDWEVSTGRVYYSPRWAEMIGYRPDELEPVYETWASRVHPDDLPTVLEALNAHVKGQNLGYEIAHRMRTKSGQWKWILTSGKLVRRDEAGRPVRITGAHKDIDDQMRAQQQLRDAEQQLRLVLNQVPAIIWTTDDQLRFTSISGAAIRHLTAEPQAMIGQSLAAYFGSDAAGDIAIDAHHQALSGRPASYRVVWQKRHYEVSLEPLRMDAQSTQGAIGVALDVTDAAQMIAALEESEQRQDRLRENLRQAQQLETVGTLAAGAAHDFNNNLLAIRAALDAAGQLLESDHPARTWLGTIGRACDQAGLVTRSLLAFSRRQSVHMECIDLGVLVRDELPTIRRILPEAVTVHDAIDPPGSCEVLADHAQMRQVLLNLLLNARDALESTPRARIDVRVYRAGETVKLQVRDNGPGMVETVSSRVFEPFFTTKPREHGTGLGLAVVHGIVADHRGTIDLDTAIGRGAMFTVTLPLYALTPTPEREHYRILLLGHLPAASDGSDLTALLTAWGYEVMTPPQVGPARTACESTDLVILADIHDERLRAFALEMVECESDVPVLVVGSPAADPVGWEAADVRWLPSPLDPGEFVEAVRRVFE